MKIGVIGAGAVGAVCIMSIIGRGAAHEIVVIDKDEGRVRGLVTDMLYGTPLCPPVRLTGGDYGTWPARSWSWWPSASTRRRAVRWTATTRQGGCGCWAPTRR